MKNCFVGLLMLLFVVDVLPISKAFASVPFLNEPVTPLMLKRVSGDRQCRQWVDSVFSTLTLKEQIGQLFIYTIAPQRSKANRALLHKVVKDYKVGGLLFSGGLMPNQAILTNETQRMSDIPLLITFDGEWGLSMRLKGTPVFPRNMVLGCIQDDSLLYQYGREMARQCRELGVQVNFAPVTDVNVNPHNPVINNRSFGADPGNVADKVIAYAKGLEDGGVLAVCKHFPGHGDTNVDSHKALPVLPFTRERLDSVELYPFRKAIQEGLDGIMVGHLEVPAYEPQKGMPASLSHNIIHGLLEQEMHFGGLIFTDALAMRGVSGNKNVCLKALKAGNDLLLVPRRIKEEVKAIEDAVKDGELTTEEIAEKCRKVLTYKYALGLYKKPFVRLSGLDSRINTPESGDLVKRLNLAAITVLNNREGLLPLDTVAKDIAVLSVGNSERIKPFLDGLPGYIHPTEFQLGRRLSDAACQSLQNSLSQYKRILVCVTEHRLADYQKFFSKFHPDAPVVYLFFIPGKDIMQIHEGVERADGVILAHSVNEDVQRETAKLLYAGAVADGRLSASIGELFKLGEGVTLSPQTPRHVIPEEYGMNSRLLAKIDTIAEEGILQGAYPGCQVVILKNGREMYNKAFGTHTWKGEAKTSSEVNTLLAATPLPVQKADVYDLASLTKTTATLLAVMKLYDMGRLNLTDRASDYLPFLLDTNKKNITIRQLLLHESGLPSTILFYEDAINAKSYKGGLFRARADKLHKVRIGRRTWANPNFAFKEGLTSKVRTPKHTLQVCDSLWLLTSFKDEYLKRIANAPLRDKRYRYSCVGFILLQQIVEKRAGMPMDKFLEKEFYAPMGLKRTGYLPLSHAMDHVSDKLNGNNSSSFLTKTDIVPAAIDPFLRKTTLQGFVHDESAAFLGGVSGNAGLFSNASEVARIYQMILNKGELDGRRYLSKTTCQVFTTTVSKISRRGLGFDKPDSKNPQKGPCAPSTPSSVYGHTGFTGTCAWVDPDNNLVYVFLSNRTYPDPWNTKLQKLEIREKIQEAMYQACFSK